MLYTLQLVNDWNDHDSKYSIFNMRRYWLTTLNNKAYQSTLPFNIHWNVEWSITQEFDQVNVDKASPDYVEFKNNYTLAIDKIVVCQIDDDFVWLIE